MKKHSYLTAAIIGVILLAMAYNYWRIFVKQDYVLTDFVACDPEKEVCFMNTCEDCDEMPQYFKLIEKRAYDVQGCDEPDHDCLPFSCEEGDSDCKVVYCSDPNASIGYPCEGVGNN